MTAQTHIGSSAAVSRQYGPYLQADWGYANHWYPAFFSTEVEEGGIKGTTIGGHDILVSRSDAKTYAVSDRCVHRGVKMSAKPMCFAKGTVSCWYHGFTYNLESGNLDTIIGNPDDKLVNKTGVRTYPCQEVNGMIYVFVGDQEFGETPQLAEDLPIKITDKEDPVAYLLDPGTKVLGIHRKLYGNWRLACENGLDPGHLLVHWDNQIIVALDRAMPLGLQALTTDATELYDVEGGPKGVMNRYDIKEYWKPILENPNVSIRARGETMYEPFRVSLWMPGTLMVENWPLPGYVQYEFYVPIDDHHHEYWEVIAYRAETDEEIKDFEFKYKNFLEPLGLRDFNDRDIFAREATEEHYQRFDGWNNETLCDMDFSVIAWRKHASKFGRGYFNSPFLDED